MPVVGYLLAGVAGAVLPGPVAAVAAGGAPVRVGLAAGPIHYDFLLPLTPAVRERFAFAEAAGVPVRHPGAEWLIVGWGAQGFYTSTATLDDMAAGTVWTAATGDAAVLRLDVTGPVAADPSVTWITLDAGRFDALVAAIAGDAGADPLPYAGFTDTDAFFPAPGRFSAGRTCNVWVGERLRAAGLRFGAWTPTPQAVQLSLWWHGLA